MHDRFRLPRLRHQAAAPGRPLLVMTLLVALAVASSCTLPEELAGDRVEQPEERRTPVPQQPARSLFTLAEQTHPPDDIRSLQLYADEDRESEPLLNLNEDQNRLTLRFDDLAEDRRTFRVRFTHHNADWSQSHLPPYQYMEGLRQDRITRSMESRASDPDYRHYTYRFPSGSARFTLSGNYMIHIYEYESDERLFSLPFFVHENEGQMDGRIQAVPAPRIDGMSSHSGFLHQPFIRFRYPGFVMLPGTELQVRVIQNRFSGRTRVADVTDRMQPGVLRSYVRREASFPGRYEFRRLELQPLQQGGRIAEVSRDSLPPTVRLRRDVIGLDRPVTATPGPLYGMPSDDRGARYVRVLFELQAPSEQPEHPVYVVGPFNNWSIRDENRMHYDPQRNAYRGQALVKQGTYDYKYVVYEDGRVDDVQLDSAFASPRQNYTALIYFRDPGLQSDRLLNIHTLEGR